MYNDDYNNEETEEVKNESTLSSFYNNNKKIIWALGIVIIVILLLSILTKGSGKKTPEDITYDITFDVEEEIVLAVGASTNLKATVENDPKATIKWSIDDSNVASIDGGNTVNIKGESIGKTKLTATYTNDRLDEPITKSKEVTVIEGDASIKLESVEFKKGDLYMPVGAKYKIKPVIKPTKARIDSKEYTSSDENVVVVDNNGEVTAVGEGTATITLNVNGEEFVKELQVYVDRSQTKTEIIVTPTEIMLNGEVIKIKMGETHKLKYTVAPEEADTEKLIWKSSDDSIVSVDVDGKIKGIKEGTATITVKAVNGQKDSIDVEVDKDIVEVTSINLTSGDIYLTEGQSITITPIVSPNNASNKTLSFRSLNESIAMSQENETGTQSTIIGISAGTTAIVITSTNNIETRVNVIVSSSSTPTPTQTPTSPPGPVVTSTPRPTFTPRPTLRPTSTPRPTPSPTPTPTSVPRASVYVNPGVINLSVIDEEDSFEITADRSGKITVYDYNLACVKLDKSYTNEVYSGTPIKVKVLRSTLAASNDCTAKITVKFTGHDGSVGEASINVDAKGREIRTGAILIHDDKGDDAGKNFVISSGSRYYYFNEGYVETTQNGKIKGEIEDTTCAKLNGNATSWRTYPYTYSSTREGGQTIERVMWSQGDCQTKLIYYFVPDGTNIVYKQEVNVTVKHT